MRETDTLVEEAAPVEPGGRRYGAILLGAGLVVFGLLWLLDVLDVIELELAVVLPALLAFVGLALMVGSFGGSQSGWVVFGAFLTAAVILVAVFPTSALEGGVGERTYRVTEMEDLASSYGVGLGELELDLAGLEVTENARVNLTVGAGQITVILPQDAEVSLDASTGAGEIDLLGETADGLSVSRTYTSSGFEGADAALTLDLNVAAGEIRVMR